MRFPPGFLHGRIVRGRKVGGLLLAESVYEPGQVLPQHAHEHARFLLVLRGSFSETSGRRTRFCPPSTLVFRRVGEPHWEAFSDRSAACLLVDMSHDWLASACEESPVLSESADFRGGLLLHLAHRLYGEFRLREAVSGLAIESLVLGMVAESWRREMRVKRGAPRWLEQVLEILHARFAEHLTLEQIARAVGVHPAHLARAFRQHNRCTLGEYLRGLRLDFVRSEMALSSTPLSQIALAAGFCDQSHFSRLFKRHTGMTPAEYRASLRAR